MKLPGYQFTEIKAVIEQWAGLKYHAARTPLGCTTKNQTKKV